MISRFVKTVFLAYDIDKAGRNATDKAIRLLNEVGVSAKIIDLGNETKDPDEFIKNSAQKHSGAGSKALPGRLTTPLTA